MAEESNVNPPARIATANETNTVTEPLRALNIDSTDDASTQPYSTRPVVLPSPGKRNVLVTSALPYVNNYPHLGNIIGAVLSADVYSRYLRQREVNVIYVCGTDEYGTATETKAQQEGLTPRQICDRYHALHRSVYQWFDIDFDIFGRTSTPHQTEIVQQIFKRVHENGYIHPDTIVQLYCVNTCKRFLADRYVNGTCPNCGFDDARGDQCDNCGNMLNPDELINPKCATCRGTPEPKSTNHLFLDLPALQGQLSTWAKDSADKGNWTTNARRLTETWFTDELKPRCITRDLKWGVPVPLEGYTDKVFYVWFDAPVGYPSITKELCGDDWKKWWMPEDENTKIDLVQFMGKDNVPFHTIMFPASLLATKQNWTLLHHINTTEYLNYEDGKFSKSRGIGVFGNDAIETGIPSEVWRYYLLLNRPEGSDAVFTWDDLATKNNDELINALGNYINRTITFLHKFFSGVVPEVIADDPENIEFTDTINTALKEYITVMEKVSLKAGLKKAMSIASIGNLYLQRKAPWHLLKNGDNRAAGSALTFSANLAVLVTLILEPFLGTKFSVKVFSQLGLEHVSGKNNIIPDSFDCTKWVKPGNRTNRPEILFTTLTTDQMKQFRRQYGGTDKKDDAKTKDGQNANEKAFALDLRVGQIVEIENHQESDRLYVAKVDVGEDSGPRTVVAGLRDVYTSEELLNKKIVMVCNLAPANLSGIESQGMILVAEKKKNTKTLSVDNSLSIGEKLAPKGVSLRIDDTPLDRKGFQTASKPLRVGKNDIIVFNKEHTLVAASNDQVFVSASGVPEGGKVK